MNNRHKSVIVRKWVHSYEEDTDEEKVYRPEGFVMPRSRGRDKIALEEEGKLINTFPGRGDALESTTGFWQVKEDKLILTFDQKNQEQYTIREVNAERLVLKKNN
ncbi:lipocalin-like domain-containing protein [Olivibacter domesticus]|uniref:Lipocalin-like domain-containing protein n=1 Tax=Olivibacter domesticus TaxID=407022 RepID=A0A1H7R0C2_OLID1|nr:lipocalin family protein [Olivibacter domesticus]SEL53438.1 hypothetical protein SAMN05661044_02783 [Olivibacter domesticus]